MLWRFEHDTFEDNAGTMHRAGCDRLERDGTVEYHPAGSTVRRDSAPKECWHCQAELEIVLGA